MKERLWTIKELAEYLHRHPNTLTRYIREGRLKASPGGKGTPYLIPDSSIKALLKPKRTPPAN